MGIKSGHKTARYTAFGSHLRNMGLGYKL